MMKPAITVLTLGVQDLHTAVAFYRDGLGWPTRGIMGTEFDNGAVAFFNLENGLKLALWPRASISGILGVQEGALCATGLTLGHNVSSEDQVNIVMAQALQAGATLVKPACKTAYGAYAGYFQDLDGHLWGVVFNPGFDLLG